MFWLAACNFGDDGKNARAQVKNSLAQAWQLGIERAGSPSIFLLYILIGQKMSYKSLPLKDPRTVAREIH